MGRQNIEDAKVYDAFFQNPFKGNLLQQAITGAFVIPAKPPFIVNLDPTGAQNVTCPLKGSRFIFLIIHKGTNNATLTIKDSTGATIGSVAQSKTAWVIDDGVATVCGVMT